MRSARGRWRTAISARYSPTIPSISTSPYTDLVRSSALYSATAAIMLILGAVVLVTVLGVIAVALIIGVGCIMGAVYCGVVASQEYKKESASRTPTVGEARGLSPPDPLDFKP